MMATRQHKSFIEELQSLDEGKKTKILIATTAVAMIVIIYFWLAYFNNIIASTLPAQPVADQAGMDAQSQAAQTSAPVEQGSWTAEISQGFKNMVSGFENIFRAPRQIDIQPVQQAPQQ